MVRGNSRTHVVAVDPGEPQPVFDFLQREGLALAAILCTHHHADHVGGVPALTERFPVPVYGPANEPVNGMTQPVRDGDRVELTAVGLTLRVLDIPGHTRGHVAYVGDGLLFCGDTLFSAGCGRLFEGTAEQMHRSLSRLAALPETTEVYCGHEYTLANLRFAEAVEPHNMDIQNHRREAEKRLAAGQPSLPSTIGRERRVNPFLRTAELNVKNAAEKQAQQPLNDGVSTFAALRRWKDNYR